MLEFFASLAAIFYLVTGVMVAGFYFGPTGATLSTYAMWTVLWPLLVIAFIFQELYWILK